MFSRFLFAPVGVGNRIAGLFQSCTVKFSEVSLCSRVLLLQEYLVQQRTGFANAVADSSTAAVLIPQSNGLKHLSVRSPPIQLIIEAGTDQFALS